MDDYLLGLSISLGGELINAGTSLASNIENAGYVQDKRLKALYEYKAVKDLNTLKERNKNLKNITKGLNVNISIGSSKTTIERTIHEETVNMSSLTAGGNVSIKATHEDVNLDATSINATNVKLDAKKDLNIGSAKNIEKTNTNSKSSSTSVGVSISPSGNVSGASIGGSSSKGKANEEISTYTESVIIANDTAILKSGRDANVLGSQVKGKNVLAAVSGNLNIASQQDTANYTAKNQNGSISIGIGKDSTTQGSVSTGKTNSDYSSVIDQAGIYAGHGGFAIYVGKNTDLKGAVISSEATPDKNWLSTGSLTWSDIKNKAEYKATSNGIGYSSDKGFSPSPGMPVSGDAESTTQSAISLGTILIRNNPKQEISKLNRTPEGALNALGKIFDKETVREKQELANLFGQEAYKAIGDLALHQYKKALEDKAKYKKGSPEYKEAVAREKLWGEGGSNKVLLHAIAGGLMSQIGGNGFTAGAASAGLNEAIQGQLAKIKDPVLHEAISAAIGAAAAKVAGGNAQVGAVAALYGTKYNWLNHYQQQELAYQLSLVSNDNDRAFILAKYQALSEYNIEKYGEQSEAIEPELYDALSELAHLSDGGLNYNLSVLTEKYGSNIDIERYKNELRVADILTTISRDTSYDGLSPERQKTLNDYYNAQTLTDKLLIGAKFLGQGWLEPITTYRNSQYQLMIANGVPENLAAAGADQMALEFAGPIVGMAIKTGDIAGSGLGNLQKVFSSEEVANAYQGIRIINKKYAGQVYEFEGELAVAYPNGVRFTKEGFPDLTPYAKLKLPVEGMTGTTSDFALANKAVGFSETPAGYTWHHVEDGQTMLLVPTTLHQAVRHTGGAALLRNGRIIADYEI